MSATVWGNGARPGDGATGSTFFRPVHSSAADPTVVRAAAQHFREQFILAQQAQQWREQQARQERHGLRSQCRQVKEKFGQWVRQLIEEEWMSWAISRRQQFREHAAARRVQQLEQADLQIIQDEAQQYCQEQQARRLREKLARQDKEQQAQQLQEEQAQQLKEQQVPQIQDQEAVARVQIQSEHHENTMHATGISTAFQTQGFSCGGYVVPPYCKDMHNWCKASKFSAIDWRPSSLLTWNLGSLRLPWSID